MQRKTVLSTTLLLLFVGLICVQDADARIFGRRTNYNSGSAGYEYQPTEYSTKKVWTWRKEKLSLQEIAQLRANAMAEQSSLDHGIHHYVNVPAAPIAEGIGYASAINYKNVGTCVCGSTVVADAWCKTKSGLIYRVRFWR